MPNGKQFRPMQVIMGYKDLMDESEQTAEKMYRIYMICWALELVRMIRNSGNDRAFIKWLLFKLFF